MTKIAILYDGRPGHLTASKGVLQSFEKLVPTEHALINVRLRMKLLRYPLCILLNHPTLTGRFSPAFQTKLIRLCYKLDADLESIKAFDWILSTGGDTSFLNAWLSKLCGIKNIYCSSLRDLNPALFTWLISARTTAPLANEIRLDLIPVPVDRQKNRDAGAAFRAEKGLGDQPLWAVLIGGDGIGYRFNNTSFAHLADGLLALAERHSARLLITTSRRTGLAAEKLLKKQLEGTPAVAHLTLYNHVPEKVVAKFTGAADLIFCTADSGSMICESIAMGTPVYALIPREVHPLARLQPLLQNNINLKRVIPRYLDEISETDVAQDTAMSFNVLQNDPVSDLAQQLMSKGVVSVEKL